MASFIFLTIKTGKEGEELQEALSISDIYPDKGEKIIEIPSHHNGKPIAYIGYHQGKKGGEACYHDWHHPAQGFDSYEPAFYYAKEDSNFKLPKGVKKIILSAEIKRVYTAVFNKTKTITYEVAPENKFIKIENNKIGYKK